MMERAACETTLGTLNWENDMVREHWDWALVGMSGGSNLTLTNLIVWSSIFVIVSHHFIVTK